MKDKKDWTVRNIPVEVLDRIREQAEENHRSLNGEIVAILDHGSRELLPFEER